VTSALPTKAAGQDFHAIISAVDPFRPVAESQEQGNQVSDHWEFFPCQMGENVAFIFYDHGIRETIGSFKQDQQVRCKEVYRVARGRKVLSARLEAHKAFDW
jgi:hypothetical protein